MKINFTNSTYILYLLNSYIKDVDFNNKDEIEKYLKEIFTIIGDRYNTLITGFFEINIYLNDSFGVIIEIEKDNLDYYDLFTNKIEMQVSIIENANLFLEIDDILNNDIYLKYHLYKDNGKYYINVDHINEISIYEEGKLIYGNIADKIAKKLV